MIVGVICKKHGKLDPAEVYTYPNGHKKCRICGREYMARHRAGVKAKAGRKLPGGGWLCACGELAVGRGSTCSACMTAKRNPVPKERLRPLVRAELASMDGDDAVAVVAERCGVSKSLVLDIVRDDSRRSGMRFEHGDKILTGLGLTYLWHLPPEQGGLSDVYEKAA